MRKSNRQTSVRYGEREVSMYPPVAMKSTYVSSHAIEERKSVISWMEEWMTEWTVKLLVERFRCSSHHHAEQGSQSQVATQIRCFSPHATVAWVYVCQQSVLVQSSSVLKQARLGRSVSGLCAQWGHSVATVGESASRRSDGWWFMHKHHPNPSSSRTHTFNMYVCLWVGQSVS